ncbi:MAG TPA: hypothetical protein VMD31_00825 [Opitutaceae bacterium]|nr:hypothetical protein [Opitutaceae bacterium]
MPSPLPRSARRMAARLVLGLAAALAPAFGAAELPPSNPAAPAWLPDAVSALTPELAGRYGAGQQARAQRGLRQVAEFWRAGDGDRAAFEAFVRANFAGDPATRDTMFNRFETLCEQLDGHMQEITRAFRQQLDLDLGPVLPFDEQFGAYDPSAHVTDDFFANKLAFVVLLNFPLTTLDERLHDGAGWSRREWAEVRLAERFAKRVPAEVNLALAEADAITGQYIADYNLWMHHLVDADGRRLFPPGMRLLSHWNLRDEIKADYADAHDGLAKQRLIQRAMERIVTQTIPAVVVNNPGVDWNPVSNEVRPAAARDSDPAAVKSTAADATPEPATRYAMLLRLFAAQRQLDAYSPTAPTALARQFDENLQIREEQVDAMIDQILTSPLVPRVARLIESRLGRPLEPFDLWYNGFRPDSQLTEAQLDAQVAAKYPTAAAYQQDIPNLLLKLGFTPEQARYLAANIVVDPARGSGHAMGAEMRTAPAHLRTRVERTGMNYKGYNIAVHEMGHNVEQTFSLNRIDHTLLHGVPNNGFTEALAFVFQGHDLELLGRPQPDARQAAGKTLDDFWSAYEMAGVARVEIEVWRWMYAHPQATPPELRDATVQIARATWNRYFAPVFHRQDVVLLGIYSHMIEIPLYLPNYFVASLVAVQVEAQMRRAGAIGPEFERMAVEGRVTPDLWMVHATGRPVGPEALLTGTEQALATVCQP